MPTSSDEVIFVLINRQVDITDCFTPYCACTCGVIQGHVYAQSTQVLCVIAHNNIMILLRPESQLETKNSALAMMKL